MHIPDLDLIDARNTLPTIAGYTSFFGTDDTLEITPLATTINIQEEFIYKTLHGNVIQLAFCEEGLYIRAVAGDAVAVKTNVPAAGSDPEYDKIDLPFGKGAWILVLSTIPVSPWKQWTFTLMSNALYVYQKGMDFIGKITSYQADQVIFEHLPPTHILSAHERHIFTYSLEEDSTGDDTYKDITITTDTGLNFGTQRVLVGSATEVSNAIQSWEAVFQSINFFTTKFTETLRTEVEIDAFISINLATEAELQTIIDATAYDGNGSELTLASVWDVSEIYAPLSYDGVFSAIPIGNVLRDIEISPDGLLLYVSDVSGDNIRQYDLTIAWDITTIVYSKYIVLGNYGGEPDIYAKGLSWSPDGLHFYFVNHGSSKIYQHDVGVAWDITSITYIGEFFSTYTQDSEPYGVSFNPTGSRMYILGRATSTIYQYDLGTKWEVESAVYNGVSLDISSEVTDVKDIEISIDGLHWYVIDDTTKGIFQYTTTNAWDLNLAFYDSRFSSVITENQNPVSLKLKSNGLELFTLDTTDKTIHQYSLPDYWLVFALIITKGIQITGFKKNYPTYLSYGANTVTLSPSDDSNTLAIALRNLYLADATISPYVGTLTVTTPATAILHYSFTLTFTLSSATPVPSSLETQDGTSVFTEDSHTQVTLAMGHVEGIMSGRSRLAAWDIDDLIYWSSASNLVDFTPSASTGANQVSVPAIKGKITSCQGFTNGFIIYATGNVVAATFKRSATSMYDFAPIGEAEGLIDYRHLATYKNLHYYWTNSGFMVLDPTNKKSTKILEEITDWIKKHRYPISLSLLAGRFLVISLQDRDEVFSNRVVRLGGVTTVVKPPHAALSPIEFEYPVPSIGLYPTYQRAIVFDIQLSKWGTCDVPHKLLISLSPYNQDGYSLDKNYQLMSATLDNEQRELALLLGDGYTRLCTTFPADSYVLFGHYAAHRDKLTKLVELSAEFVDYPNGTIEIEQSLDGAKVDFTSLVSTPVTTLAHDMNPNLAARWFNILVKGQYHLKRLLAKGYSYGRR
jgi:DNA-binding beta-propeller fold protein YncE